MNSTQALSEPVARAIRATARQEAIWLTRTAASTSNMRTMTMVPTINSMTLSPDTSRSVDHQRQGRLTLVQLTRNPYKRRESDSEARRSETACTGLQTV